MMVYIALLGFELFCCLFANGSTVKDKWFLRISLFALFFVSAFKSNSVGIDTSGYAAVYSRQTGLSWSDFGYFYFEPGYMLLMKIASKAMGLSFNEFCVVVYAFIYFSIYRFIKKHSADYTLSVLLFTCYTFFIFFLTGLRNAIAIAICLWAFDHLMNRNRKDSFLFLVIVLAASTIHTSALIFLLAYPLSRYEPDARVALVLIAISAFALIFRNQIFSFINTTFRDVGDAGSLSVGGSSILLICLSCFSSFAVALHAARYSGGDGEATLHRTEISMCVFLWAGTLLTMFSPGDSVLIRTAMYYTVFASVLVPNSIGYCERHFSWLARCFLVIFLALFFISSVKNNSLMILPYEMWI